MLEDLEDYTVTIAKTDDGYTIKTADGNYVTNIDGTPNIALRKDVAIGAESIKLQSNNTFEIILNAASKELKFGFNSANQRFNYFPNWNGKTAISLYEYVE